MKDVAIKITEISLIPFKPKDGLLGFASFVLNEQFYLGEIAIRSCLNGGIRLVYPVKKILSGKDIALYHPINKETGDKVQQAIASEWEVLMRFRGNA